MNYLYWALDQFLSYGPWLLLLLVPPLLGAYMFRWKGLFIGHLAVAVLIAALDYYWIQSEMKKPGWDGLPDMDVVFYMGVLGRVFMINALTLVLAITLILIRKPSRGTNLQLDRQNKRSGE